MCTLNGAPLVRVFSPNDISGEVYTCYRVDKHVAGVDWRTWAGWFKLAKYLTAFDPLA